MANNNNFTMTLPDVAERRKMSPYAAAKVVLAAYEAAFEELRRRGARVDVAGASALLGYTRKGDVYHQARAHVEAVDVFGISASLPRSEAIARMRQLNPSMLELGRIARDAQVTLSDTELHADAIAALVRSLSDTVTKYDVTVIAGYLIRYKNLRDDTKSGLTDLIRWLTTLERAL
jgi:hypothetical protein